MHHISLSKLTLVLRSEPAYRRQGLAKLALAVFLRYTTVHGICQVDKLLVRISAANEPSIALFSTLGFALTKEANVFGEIEMRFSGEPEDIERNWAVWSTELDYPL